jgi:hypothetical protein
MITLISLIYTLFPSFNSKSKLSYDRRSVSQSVLVSGHHQARYQFFFLFEIFFRHLRIFYFVAPSLTGGWVCNLLLLLVLASALPPDSRPYFIVPILETPQPGGPGPRIYIPPEQSGPDKPPSTGFPFRRRLRLAGLRWSYSIPLPQGNFA